MAGIIGAIIAAGFVVFIFNAQTLPYQIRIEPSAPENPVSNRPSSQSKVDQKFVIEIYVLDELSNLPLADAEVYLNGAYVCRSDSNGICRIQDVKEGSHNLMIKYIKEEKNQQIRVDQSSTRFQFVLKAPRTITVRLVDTETRKPIQGVKIFIEGSQLSFTSRLPTDDQGRTTIESIPPGDYQVRLENIPFVPSKLLSVGSSSSVEVDVDMPNPRLTGSLKCQESGILDRFGTCTVTLSNLRHERPISSQGTVVLLFVYIDNQLQETDIMNLGDIPVGGSVTKVSNQLKSFRFGVQETVIAVILEGWRYTPESQTQIGEYNAPPSLVASAVRGITQYCGQNPDICVKVVTGIISFIAG